MSLDLAISRLRLDANMSQEKLSEVLNVTRQAVQKWESGSAQPDLDNIIKIAKFFNVSIDALVLDSGKRISEEFLEDKKIQPEYSKIHNWELYSSELPVEYRQSIEEGKDVQLYEPLFKAVSKMPAGKYKEKMSDIIFDMLLEAPQIKDYPYNEPNDLNGIKLLRPGFTYPGQSKIDRHVLKEKIEGTWVGRICGCLLGKPVEGIKTNELYPILKASGNYPMHRYIKSTDITEEMCETYTFRLRNRCYADTISCAPSDDDTNYVVLASILVEKYGRNFTPYDVSKVWLQYQPKDAYCTAERVAFRNFVNGFVPPHSAMYKNPYREWIGAQIRGDYFGYINPGNPQAAADMAWRDASVSHTKNGIYGEMFVAAMIACAAVNDDMEGIINGGLAQIPKTSRLFEAVSGVAAEYKKGVGRKECFHRIHKIYDEQDVHHWCHTISNAMIVAASLLYGNGHYGESICMAVQAGFDTDCNGATVGSILGMRNGIKSIGEEWTKPVNGELETSIFGMGKVKISDMVEATMKHI